jgi:hypothetical protein
VSAEPWARTQARNLILSAGQAIEVGATDKQAGQQIFDNALTRVVNGMGTPQRRLDPERLHSLLLELAFMGAIGWNQVAKSEKLKLVTAMQRLKTETAMADALSSEA